MNFPSNDIMDFGKNVIYIQHIGPNRMNIQYISYVHMYEHDHWNFHQFSIRVEVDIIMDVVLFGSTHKGDFISHTHYTLGYGEFCCML